MSDVPEELVGFDATLPDPSIPLGSSANIVLQQWLSPFDFYVTLKAFEAPLDDMMRQLQRFYTNRRPVTTKPSIGALVIVWHQADEAFKRAKIIDYSAPRDKFKVHLIDFGGRAICLPKDIYELERSFARLAPLAVHCTLDNDVVLNRPAKELLDVPSAYVTADSAVAAEFIRSASGRAVVSVQVNQANLVDLMVRDRLLVKLPDGMCVGLWCGLVTCRATPKVSWLATHPNYRAAAFLLLSIDRYSHGAPHWTDAHRAHHVNHERNMFPSPILWL